MKRKALAIVLTLVMLVGVLPMGAFAASYTDTEGHWAEKSIDRWTEAKVLEGMGDNTYAPDKHLSRAEAMTIFSRLLKLTEKADISKVTDVEADVWYTPYIETGYAYQIIKGTSDTTFDPLGSITREQFFSIFARAMGIPSAATCDKTFTDMDQISPWAVTEGSVYSMINRGYLDGYPDGSLQPTGKITRAEVAKVLDNAISDYITEDGTYAISGNGIVVVLAKDVKLTGNFNGHIVSSCPDSTLNLSGLSGTPYIYVLGDNTKIVSAKPGTKVAVNPAADNVTANGVKVTNPPYTPEKPYIVPGGGTGGGPGGSTTQYRAFANVIYSTDKDHGAKLYTKYYSVSEAQNKTMADIIRELAGISGDNAKYNENQIKAAYTEAYNKVKDTAENKTSDGNVYDILIENGVITHANKTDVTGFTEDKTDKYLGEISANFVAALEDVAEAHGLARTSIDAFAQAADPANLVNGRTILNADQFFTQYWTPAVEAAITFVDTLQGQGFTDFSGLFGDILAVGQDCDFDSLAKEGVNDAGFFPAREYSSNRFDFVSYDHQFNGADDALTEASRIFPFNFVNGNGRDKDVKVISSIIEGKANLNGKATIEIYAVNK